jgi:hypothetical protein
MIWLVSISYLAVAVEPLSLMLQSSQQVYRAAIQALDDNDCGKAAPLLEEYLRLEKQALINNRSARMKIEAQLELCRPKERTRIIFSPQ